VTHLRDCAGRRLGNDDDSEHVELRAGVSRVSRVRESEFKKVESTHTVVLEGELEVVRHAVAVLVLTAGVALHAVHGEGTLPERETLGRCRVCAGSSVSFERRVGESSGWTHSQEG